jgi:hypothetical protein
MHETTLEHQLYAGTRARLITEPEIIAPFLDRGARSRGRPREAVT